MGESWDVNNFKQGLGAEKGQNYKPTFGAMRQLSTNERGVIADVKVVDVEKRRSKEHSGSKNYEYVLKVRWLDENQYCIFRRYSMFFDLQAGLRQLFQEKQHITIPELPGKRILF